MIQRIYDTTHKKSILKDTNFRRATLKTVGFVSTKPLKWRKQFFLEETILKSVAFHLRPFQLAIPNFLSYSVKR